jgi:hypothetical protein
MQLQCVKLFSWRGALVTTLVTGAKRAEKALRHRTSVVTNGGGLTLRDGVGKACKNGHTLRFTPHGTRQTRVPGLVATENRNILRVYAKLSQTNSF